VTPTAKTLGYLRRAGWLPAVVESWIPKINRRRDLWGFADVLAVHPRDRVFLLVQVTTISNVASRLAKARGRHQLALWLKGGGRFEVHGWRGAELKIVDVQAGDLAPILVSKPRRRTANRHHQGELFAAGE
jgi:hypothetical protein